MILPLIVFSLLATQVTSNLNKLKASEDEETLLVVEIGRHGTRIPITTVHKPLPDWTMRVPAPQLTDIGHRQHYYLGREMAKQFPQIFNKKLRRENIYVRSTRIQRTLASAQAHLMGAFSSSVDPGQMIDQLEFDYTDERQLPQTVTKEEAKILFKGRSGPTFPGGFVPFIANSFKSGQDYLLDYLHPESCPVGAKKNDKKIEEFKQDLRKQPGYLEVVKKAAEIFDIDMNEISDPTDISINIGDFVGLDWRNNLNPKVPRSHPYYSKFRRYIEAINTVAMLDPQIRAAAIAPLIMNIVELLKKGSTNATSTIPIPNNPRYVYYSSHDTVVAPLLELLGQLDPACFLRDLANGFGSSSCGEFPDTAANVVFELYTQGGYNKVRIYSNLKVIRVFGREEHTLEDFTRDITKLINPKWKEFCKPPEDPATDDNSSTDKDHSSSSSGWRSYFDMKNANFWRMASFIATIIFVVELLVGLKLYTARKKALGSGVNRVIHLRKGSDSLSSVTTSPLLPAKKKGKNFSSDYFAYNSSLAPEA